ncbi:hypothetical protein Daus18300_007386 [Diaporthe australafricana]|uniref:Aflatoxin regulatory protein domain-containing protein n=1 Tax=Diaporthe australafricana TaxID=127596 RepID=A0ABR3WNE0_9PEZI
MFNGAMVLETESNALTSPLSGTMLENSPGMTSVGDDGFNSLSAVGDPSGLTQQQSRLLPSPLTILVGLDSQIGEQERSSATKDGETQQDAGHCYLAILQRLTQLEDTLNTGPQPPRLDVVLTAERDTRTLKERLFACQGHGRQELDISTSPTIPKDRGQEPCIDAHGSSLLVISLLADRVISLLEDLFRRAAVSSHALDQATRGTTASWLLGSPPGFSSQAGERRFERSARSSFSRDIHCPVPEANCELTIGSYEIDAEVKSRVMKRILKQRVSALERMVGDLKNYLMDVTGQDDRSGRERTEPRAGEQGGILLGNVPRSQGLSQAATAHMIEDLHWRVELLQGRLELAGY